MEKVKPWQVVLIVLAVGMLGVVVWKYASRPSLESQLANSMTLVDVQTGQRYIANLRGKHAIIIPWKNPDNDNLSLIPAYEKDGNWYLWDRYRSSLQQVEVPHDAVPDPDGPIKVLDASPIKLKN